MLIYSYRTVILCDKLLDKLFFFIYCVFVGVVISVYDYSLDVYIVT